MPPLQNHRGQGWSPTGNKAPFLRCLHPAAPLSTPLMHMPLCPKFLCLWANPNFIDPLWPQLWGERKQSWEVRVAMGTNQLVWKKGVGADFQLLPSHPDFHLYSNSTSSLREGKLSSHRRSSICLTSHMVPWGFSQFSPKLLIGYYSYSLTGCLCP